MNQYCSGCHNQDDLAGGMALDKLDFEKVGKDAAVWERVVRKVRTGMMPPSGQPRPPRATLDAFATELETRLDKAAAANPNVGSPVLHRLNRTEYANVIRDLLAIDVDVSTMLPSDDSNEGFDNIADALGVSPTLIQGYVSAAMKISRRAVGDRTLIPTQTTFIAPSGLVQDKRLEGLPLGTRGGMLIKYTFPLDAEYQITVGGGGGAPVVEEEERGVAAVEEPISRLDGQPITVRGNQRLTVKAGPHTIGMAVIEGRKAGGIDDAYSDHRVNAQFAIGGGVSTLVITGPFNATGAGDTPSRNRIFVCHPANASEEDPCARKILTTLARRAFRRPLADDSEVEALMTFYQKGRKDGDFEVGIQQALARILVAPRFIFRMEDEPANVKAGATAIRMSGRWWSCRGQRVTAGTSPAAPDRAGRPSSAGASASRTRLATSRRTQPSRPSPRPNGRRAT